MSAPKAVECAANDGQTLRYLSLIDEPLAHLSADAEREVLWFVMAIAIRRLPAFPQSTVPIWF